MTLFAGRWQDKGDHSHHRGISCSESVARDGLDRQSTLPTTQKIGMVLSVFWPGSTPFYPIGDTPAVDLTDTLTPEETAHVLLLGCGDSRNILFTVHSQRHDSELTTVFC